MRVLSLYIEWCRKYAFHSLWNRRGPARVLFVSLVSLVPPNPGSPPVPMLDSIACFPVNCLDLHIPTPITVSFWGTLHLQLRVKRKFERLAAPNVTLGRRVKHEKYNG